jgi:drug/metabolite transporter (DMT)-like permease
MSWIAITIIAYFLLAAVNFGDKFLIEKIVPNSKVYAFLISIMGALVLLLAPWFLSWPGFNWFLVDILAGAVFPLALFFQFEALKRGDASRVTVIIGGLVPIFSTLGAIAFLGDRFSIAQWSGMAMLLLGTFVIALATKSIGKAEKMRSVISLAALSALSFAIFFLVSKHAYNNQDFWSSFIWIRVGSALAALFFLVKKADRQAIFTAIRPVRSVSGKKSSGLFVIINQAFGALGSILQNYALSFGSVAVINSLQGVQYAFLLVFGWVGTAFFPKFVKESTTRSIMLMKAAAIILISIGLYFII